MSSRKLIGAALLVCLLGVGMAGCQLLRKPVPNLQPPVVLSNPENPEGVTSYRDSGLPTPPPPLDATVDALRGNFVVAMAGFYIDMGWLAAGPAYNVQKASRMLDGTVLQPGEVFSFNERIGPYSSELGWQEGAAYSQGEVISSSGGGVCKVATTLYNVAVLANLEILERRNHGLPVPYVQAGQDATVSEGGPDLKLRNSYPQPVLLKASVDGSKLYMGVYGSTAPPRISWEHKLLGQTEPPVVYRENPRLAPGEERVVREGMTGVATQSWLLVRGAGGMVERRNMGVSNYAPLARIVERGVVATTESKSNQPEQERPQSEEEDVVPVVPNQQTP